MGEALGVRGAADGGNTEAQRHGEKPEMGESRRWGKAGDGGKQEWGE